MAPATNSWLRPPRPFPVTVTVVSPLLMTQIGPRRSAHRVAQRRHVRGAGVARLTEYGRVHDDDVVAAAPGVLCRAGHGHMARADQLVAAARHRRVAGLG